MAAFCCWSTASCMFKTLSCFSSSSCCFFLTSSSSALSRKSSSDRSRKKPTAAPPLLRFLFGVFSFWSWSWHLFLVSKSLHCLPSHCLCCFSLGLRFSSYFFHCPWILQPPSRVPLFLLEEHLVPFLVEEISQTLLLPSSSYPNTSSANARIALLLLVARLWILFLPSCSSCLLYLSILFPFRLTLFYVWMVFPQAFCDTIKCHALLSTPLGCEGMKNVITFSAVCTLQ